MREFLIDGGIVILCCLVILCSLGVFAGMALYLLTHSVLWF